LAFLQNGEKVPISLGTSRTQICVCRALKVFSPSSGSIHEIAMAERKMTGQKLVIGKYTLNLYQRGSSHWHCSVRINGERFRHATKHDSLIEAKEAAENWFLELRGKARAGTPVLPKKKEKTFAEAAAIFENEYEAITSGHRSPEWVRGHKDRIRLHLNPFFGLLGISEVTAGKVQEYRVHRAGQVGRVPPKDENGDYTRPLKPPSRSTVHDEIVSLRQVLKTALRHGWITHLPDLSSPYKTQGKIVHRPWFSRQEYKAFYKAAGDNAEKATGRSKWMAGQLHDFVLFMANTGLRPDEALNLQHRDVAIVKDAATDKVILEIEVRGKRGVGYCKSMPGAVRPYERLLARPKPMKTGRLVERKRLEKRGLWVEPKQEYPQAKDHLFPGSYAKAFNQLLDKIGLKYDRDGQPRSAYSLRHTYICLRLMEGADIYQIAKNCRTSVEMIQKFYAPHIKDVLDTTTINVRRPKSAKNQIIRKSIDPVEENDEDEDELDDGSGVRPSAGSLAMPAIKAVHRPKSARSLPVER
jgi:integrase